jgi:phosphotransferase system enzyme I (PtsI)
MRGIRLCLKERNAFLIQISALLRASVFGNLAIMFPMVSSLDEVLILKEIVQEMKLNLEAQGISVSKKIQIGIMIEVPAAAMITDVLAKHVDFFSIGTNDLTQYTCATDRLNEHTRVFYEPFHPGVLKLIAMTIENAHKNGIWAGMCGSIAAKKEMVPFLLGVGLDEFSVDSNSILSLRSRIAQLTMSDCKALAKQALNCETASAVKALMSNSLQ